MLKASNASGETAFGQSTGLNHIRIGDVEMPTDAGGGVYLKFRHFNKAAYIPAWKVLAGEVSQEEIEGRIILVGTSAPGLLDLRATPVDAAVPGIDIHAQLLEHLLTGKFLERPDYALALEEFVILVLGIMLAFALPRVSAKTSAAIGLLTIATRPDGWVGRISILASLYRSIVSSPGSGVHDRRHHLLHLPHRGGTAQPDPPRLRPISCSRAGRAAGAIAGEARAGWRRARDDHPDERRARLYHNFRVYKDDPQGLTSLMNRLLTPLTNTIVSHEGTIDKYIGDAIMGFWNAPLNVPDHELKACAAALDMIDRLEVLNRERQQEAAALARHSCHFASASA